MSPDPGQPARTPTPTGPRRSRGGFAGARRNGEPLTGERPLTHGDRVRLGQTDAVELQFLCEEDGLTRFRTSGSSLPDLPQISSTADSSRTEMPSTCANREIRFRYSSVSF